MKELIIGVLLMVWATSCFMYGYNIGWDKGIERVCPERQENKQ